MLYSQECTHISLLFMSGHNKHDILLLDSEVAEDAGEAALTRPLDWRPRQHSPSLHPGGEGGRVGRARRRAGSVGWKGLALRGGSSVPQGARMPHITFGWTDSLLCHAIPHHTLLSITWHHAAQHSIAQDATSTCTVPSRI